MTTICRAFLPFLLILTLVAPVAFSQPRPDQYDNEPVMVGHITHIEGELLRYVPEERDWVATVKDAPFGLEDALYSNGNGRAEFIMPNGTWARIGPNTQIQMISLGNDATEIDEASGTARFLNRSRGTLIKVTTPFGYVVAPSGTVFDLYVGDRSIQVVPLRGTVDFVSAADGRRYEVSEGSSALLADNRGVARGEGRVDPGWDGWNEHMDGIWAKRLDMRGDSARYLPSPLQDQAYALDENGNWERVYYDGDYRYFWRPEDVADDWTPFSVGRWSVYYGDNCWIPDEPFGYVTHHYGNWVYVGHRWYWAPPDVASEVGVGPGLHMGFGWYPGRVAWIHSGPEVGWVPLAPSEPYYTYRAWGRRAMMASRFGPGDAHVNPGRLRYVDHAVIVNKNRLYAVNNYRKVRIAKIERSSIVNNYRAVPVISNAVVNNYSGMKQKYNFTNINVVSKPHGIALDRIERNARLGGADGRLDARRPGQDAVGVRQGGIGGDVRIDRPKVSDRPATPVPVNKPGSEMQFHRVDGVRKPGPVEEVRQHPGKANWPGGTGVTGSEGRRAATERPEVMKPPQPGPRENFHGVRPAETVHGNRPVGQPFGAPAPEERFRKAATGHPEAVKPPPVPRENNRKVRQEPPVRPVVPQQAPHPVQDMRKQGRQVQPALSRPPQNSIHQVAPQQNVGIRPPAHSPGAAAKPRQAPPEKNKHNPFQPEGQK